jgi:hypothetical protein
MSSHLPADPRRRYLLALPSSPIRDRTRVEADDSGLPVLARRIVGDRTVRFALVHEQARFRLTFVGLEPALLGHVAGLNSDDPTCYVSEPAHLEWARTADHARQILDIAVFTWQHRRRLLQQFAAARDADQLR